MTLQSQTGTSAVADSPHKAPDAKAVDVRRRGTRSRGTRDMAPDAT